MQEPLEISFNDVEKTPRLESLVHEKAERLEKFSDELISCHVDVAQPHAHPDSGSGYRVRIDLRVPPKDQLVAHEHSSHGNIHDTVETVVRRAFDAIERQLKEHTERLREGQREHSEEDVPGTVIVIDKDKRYGIIKTVAGRDIYFTDKAVLHEDFDRIEIGTAVRYVDQPGDDGPRASTVEIVEKKGQAMARPGPGT
ncbi:MAG: HPF/RaiA family ribosome-associated protein [Opitutales bacterium]